MPNHAERSLPRDFSSRITMGVAALLFGIMCGMLTIALWITPLPGLSTSFQFIVAVTEELTLGATIAMALLVIWSLATPRWIENLFRKAWHHLLIVIVASVVIPVVVAFLCRLMGITLIGSPGA